VYCEGNNLEFKIFTEKDLGVYNWHKYIKWQVY
jgi:hypothetical protein